MVDHACSVLSFCYLYHIKWYSCFSLLHARSSQHTCACIIKGLHSYITTETSKKTVIIHVIPVHYNCFHNCIDLFKFYKWATVITNFLNKISVGECKGLGCMWNTRFCIFFIRCLCGHHKLSHDAECTSFSNDGEPWQANKHTATSPTNAFGQIDFQGGTATSFATKAQVSVSKRLVIAHLTFQGWSYGGLWVCPHCRPNITHINCKLPFGFFC